MRPRIAFIVSTLPYRVNLEIEYCFLKATGGRVRTPKASRNPAQQPDFVTALLSFIQARQQSNAARFSATF
jgi:hypothetical protein